MIIVIQNQLPHYRRELFNKLCDVEQVLVVHSGIPSVRKEDRFLEEIVPSYKIGPFKWQAGIFDIIKRNRPSAVIASADIHNIVSIIAMFRLDKKLRWIWWGMDRGASELALGVKTWLALRNNPIVFYNEEIRKEFLDRGLNKNRLFVANNTFHVQNSRSLADALPKDIFINVGTLDARKQNDLLIRAFNEVYKRTGRDIYLYLIGDGNERRSLELIIAELKLEGRVILTGKIEDPHALETYYARAIASVSFGQAGLAVLQSMAFGVPFITKRAAISGGEKYNIINGHNGIFCSEDPGSLVEAMFKLVQDPVYAKSLGSNAYVHYCDRASIARMVDGFRAALEYR